MSEFNPPVARVSLGKPRFKRPEAPFARSAAQGVASYVRGGAGLGAQLENTWSLLLTLQKWLVITQNIFFGHDRPFFFWVRNSPKHDTSLARSGFFAAPRLLDWHASAALIWLRPPSQDATPLWPSLWNRSVATGWLCRSLCSLATLS